jgi:Transposase zinc-ribbon domain
MRAWFRDDDACLDYLDWLRWAHGPVCSHCGCINCPRPMKGRWWRCSECDARVSRTAGTIFPDTRTPLTVWFAAAWEVTADKSGMSALAIQRRLELGSYQTAWTMLHRFRAATALAGQDLLTGTVEVDETVLGGPRAGPPGRVGRWVSAWLA